MHSSERLTSPQQQVLCRTVLAFSQTSLTAWLTSSSLASFALHGKHHSSDQIMSRHESSKRTHHPSTLTQAHPHDLNPHPSRSARPLPQMDHKVAAEALPDKQHKTKAAHSIVSKQTAPCASPPHRHINSTSSSTASAVSQRLTFTLSTSTTTASDS